MCLVDYKGFRLSAISLLPLSRKTLVYGSPDGGQTIINNKDEASHLADLLACMLNLKPHKAGKDCIEVATCADLEIHKIQDHYYAIDAARLFPTQARPKGPSEMFSRLLRPELVRSNPAPLSSDAFSGFQKHDRDKGKHNREV
jgi:hypothetical protein